MVAGPHRSRRPRQSLVPAATAGYRKPAARARSEVRFGCGADLLHVLRAVNSWRKSHDVVQIPEYSCASNVTLWSSGDPVPQGNATVTFDKV